jgi:hypothetical protein
MALRMVVLVKSGCVEEERAVVVVVGRLYLTCDTYVAGVGWLSSNRWANNRLELQ